MRLKLNILLITLLALFSCAKENVGRGSDDQGTGTLHVRFDIPANAGVTKVDDVSGGGYDGTKNVLTENKDNIIQHGRLFLVDKKNIVVAYRKAVENKNGVIGNSSGTEVITGIKRGDYKLYVFVNGSKEQAKIFDDNHKTLVGSELASTALLETKLSKNDLVGGNSPTFTDAEGIPCTFVTDVAITAGNNYVDAHLERCVGRLTIKVLNNIPDMKLAIRSIGLSADNPVTGYYYPHDGSVGTVAFPDLTEMVELVPNENKTIFDHYVYETNVVNEGLSFDLLGAVYGKNDPVKFENGSFSGEKKEITREKRQIKIVDTYGDAQPLRQIKRNEHVTVSINIFYNRELGEFDFKVSSWKKIDNTTTFD